MFDARNDQHLRLTSTGHGDRCHGDVQRQVAARQSVHGRADNTTVGPKLAQQIQSLQEGAARLDSEVGFLAWELRPAALDDLGFAAATRNFVAEWSKHYSIPAELHTGKVEGRRLSQEVETNLYRITQEALNNIAKHAGAQNVNVVIERRKGEIVLIIEDDGKGFDPSLIEPGRESGKGLGLVGMVLWQASEAPDIAGKWTGPEWGDVVLEQKEPGEYEGTYTDTFKQMLQDKGILLRSR